MEDEFPVGENRDNLKLIRINETDTIKKMVETINNNFEQIASHGGGPTGLDGKDGKNGAPGSQGTPGKDGITPRIKIGSNKHWIINDVDTGIVAEGRNGRDGKDGIDGSMGMGRSIMAFKGTDTRTIPDTPTGGKFDTSTWNITYPTGWGDSNELNGKFVWVSTCEFDNDGNNRGNWSTPFCITGEDGDNGTDGESSEYIYKTFTDKDEFENYDSSELTPNNWQTE